MLVNKTFSSLIYKGFPSLLSVSRSLRYVPGYLHTSSVQPANGRGQLPTVYYYQNPFRWLTIKWRLYLLRKWDKEFSEHEFRRGSSHAVATVASIIAGEGFDGLQGMMTAGGLQKLRRDSLFWDAEIEKDIGIVMTDIKLALPTQVQMHTRPPAVLARRVVEARRECDIDMWYMAMKYNGQDSLIILEFVARFKRDFTTGMRPEWNLSVFELRKFHVYQYGENV